MFLNENILKMLSLKTDFFFHIFLFKTNFKSFFSSNIFIQKQILKLKKNKDNNKITFKVQNLITN